MNIDDTDIKSFLNANANVTSDSEARSAELTNRVATLPSATDAVISRDTRSSEGLRCVPSDQSPCITVSSADEDDTPIKEKSSSIPARDSDGGDCGIVRYVTSPTLKPNTVACARGSSTSDSRQTSVKEVDQSGSEISRQSSSSTTSGNVFSADSRQTSVKEIDRSSGEVTSSSTSRQVSTATASTDVQSLSALEAEARRGNNERDAADSVRYVSSPHGGEDRLPSVVESFDTIDDSQLDITDSAFECWRIVNAPTESSDYEQINLIPKCSSREGKPLPPTPDDDNHVYADTAEFTISISIYHRCLKRLACKQLGRVLLASVITAVALILCGALLYVFLRPSAEPSLQMSAVHRRSILVNELESAYRGIGIVSVSQDGEKLLVGESQTSTLLICDLDSTSPTAPTAAINCTPVPLPDRTTIWDAAWTPQGDIALAAYYNRSIIIVRPSGSVVDIQPVSGPLHFTVSTDNVIYAADYYDGIYELTASERYGLTWRIVHRPPSRAIGFYDVVNVQHTTATGDNGEETTARFWVLEDNFDTYVERLCYFSADSTVQGHHSDCQSAAMPNDVQIYLNVSKLAYDGRDGVLVIDSLQEAVHVWSASTGQYRGQLLSYVHSPQRVAVDPTRRLLYVGRKSGLVDVYELLYNETRLVS